MMLQKSNISERLLNPPPAEELTLKAAVVSVVCCSASFVYLLFCFLFFFVFWIIIRRKQQQQQILLSSICSFCWRCCLSLVHIQIRLKLRTYLFIYESIRFESWKRGKSSRFYQSSGIYRLRGIYIENRLLTATGKETAAPVAAAAATTTKMNRNCINLHDSSVMNLKLESDRIAYCQGYNHLFAC